MVYNSVNEIQKKTRLYGSLCLYVEKRESFYEFVLLSADSFLYCISFASFSFYSFAENNDQRLKIIRHWTSTRHNLIYIHIYMCLCIYTYIYVAAVTWKVCVGIHPIKAPCFDNFQVLWLMAKSQVPTILLWVRKVLCLPWHPCEWATL